MRKNGTVLLSGMVKWFTHLKPDPWGNFTVNLYLDPPSLEKFEGLKKLGLRNELKKDEDGVFVRLRRPTSKLMKGKVVTFNPPEVFDAEGKPANKLGIGNGTTGTCKVFQYWFKTPQGGDATAIRWDAFKIKDLVPYEAPRDFTEEQEVAYEGLATATVEF